MQDVIADTVAQRRALMLLLALFACLALLLAVIGVYRVVAYATRQRIREIAVRRALGADRASVLGMILRKGFMLGIVGVGVGLVGAAGITHTLQSLLFEVGRFDPVVYIATALLWGGLSTFAALGPARRGSLVHPAEVLRRE